MRRPEDMIEDLNEIEGKTVQAAVEMDDDACILFTDGKMLRIRSDCPLTFSSLPLSTAVIGYGRHKDTLIKLGVCTEEEWNEAAASRQERIVAAKRRQLEELKKELGES